MKILHVITSLRTGGAERLMVDLLPRLSDENAQVELCVFDGVRTPFYEELEARGVRIVPLGRSVYSPLHILRLARLMRHYDIVHTHNTACQLYAAVAGLFAKCRLVTTEHNTSNRRRGKAVWHWVDRWMYSRYDRIVSVSAQTQANLLVSLYGSGERADARFEVVENGIDLTRYGHTPASSPARDSDGASPFVMLMVSAFRWEKDQKTVVRALPLLGEDYEVWFAGGGDEQLRQECLVLAAELGVKSQVKMLGLQSDIPALQAQADVIVHSSHLEGLCLSVVEGMASGKPVVVSDVEGVAEIVRGHGVIFPHEDAAALAVEIRKLRDNPDNAAAIARQCQARAKAYDIREMARRYREVYETIIR